MSQSVENSVKKNFKFLSTCSKSFSLLLEHFRNDMYPTNILQPLGFEGNLSFLFG